MHTTCLPVCVQDNSHKGLRKCPDVFVIKPWNCLPARLQSWGLQLGPANLPAESPPAFTIWTWAQPRFLWACTPGPVDEWQRRQTLSVQRNAMSLRPLFQRCPKALRLAALKSLTGASPAIILGRLGRVCLRRKAVVSVGWKPGSSFRLLRAVWNLGKLPPLSEPDSSFVKWR